MRIYGEEFTELWDAVLPKDAEFLNSVTEHTIFKYLTKPALGLAYGGGTQVEDLPENNLTIGDRVKTIPYGAIERIKTIIADNEALEITELEFPPITDGDEQYMFFRSGDRTNAILGSNQGYYWNNEDTNAFKMMRIVEEIENIVLKCNNDQDSEY